MFNKIYNYKYLILGFFLIILSYFPFLKFNFLYADDYLYLFPKIGFSESNNRFYEIDSFWSYFHNIGRPLTAHLILLQQILIENIATGKLFRLFSLILLTILFYLFFIFFLEKKISKNISFLISFSIISLPAFNLTIAWLTLQQTILSAIFSILSFLILNKINNKEIHENLFSLFLSSLFLIFSLFLYPVASMFFFIFYFIDVFFSLIKTIKKINLDIFKIFLPIFFFIINLLISFIIIKLYYNSIGAFEINQISKFIWFLKEIIPLSINFFYPSKSLFLGILFLITIYITISISLFSRVKKNVFIYSAIILFFFIIYSYLLLTPIIVAYGYFTSSFRIIPVVSSFYLIIFLFSFKFVLKEKAFSIFLVTIFLISFATNLYQSYNFFGKPHFLEFESMKSILKNRVNKNTKYIHIFRPNSLTGDVPFRIFDGSDYGMYSSSISSSLKGYVYLALKEINLDPNNYNISSSVENSENEYDNRGDPIPLKDNLIIIDFKNFINQNK